MDDSPFVNPFAAPPRTPHIQRVSGTGKDVPADFTAPATLKGWIEHYQASMVEVQAVIDDEATTPNTRVRAVGEKVKLSEKLRELQEQEKQQQAEAPDFHRKLQEAPEEALKDLYAQRKAIDRLIEKVKLQIAGGRPDYTLHSAHESDEERDAEVGERGSAVTFE